MWEAVRPCGTYTLPISVTDINRLPYDGEAGLRFDPAWLVATHEGG